MEQMSNCCKHSRSLHCFYPKLVGRAGWFVGYFGFNGPFRQYFSLYRAISQREGERRELTDERKKMSKQPPPAPTASTVGPCSTIFQTIIRSHGTGSLPSTIAPPDHPKDAPALKVTQCHHPARSTTLPKRPKVK